MYTASDSHQTMFWARARVCVRARNNNSSLMLYLYIDNIISVCWIRKLPQGLHFFDTRRRISNSVLIKKQHKEETIHKTIRIDLIEWRYLLKNCYWWSIGIYCCRNKKMELRLSVVVCDSYYIYVLMQLTKRLIGGAYDCCFLSVTTTILTFPDIYYHVIYNWIILSFISSERDAHNIRFNDLFLCSLCD